MIARGPGLRGLLLAALVAGLAAAPVGCARSPNAFLHVGQAAVSGAQGALKLQFALPARSLQYVPAEVTRSVRITCDGPRNDDGYGGFDQDRGTFDLTPGPGNVATVNVPNLAAGRNVTVRVDAYTGTGGSGRLLETLYGVVDIPAGGVGTGTVSRETTPVGLAVLTLRRRADNDRLVSTDFGPLQALADNFRAANGNLSPALLRGDQLAFDLMQYTLNQPTRKVEDGFAIPTSPSDPVLINLIGSYYQAPSVQVFDLYGTSITSNVGVWVEDVASTLQHGPTFAFPFLFPPSTPPTGAPETYKIHADGENGDPRKFDFVRQVSAPQNVFNTAILSGVSTSFAGTGSPGPGVPDPSPTPTPSGSPGSPAPGIQFSDPHQACLDAAGNLYVADTGNHRVVKVAPDGRSSVVAGTGAAGTDGLGGPAAAARLNGPQGVAVDGDGVLYVADTGNHRLVVVDPATQQIAAFAGDGTAGNPASVVDGRADQVHLNAPTTLAVGGTVVYFHDSGNRTIRKSSAGLRAIATNSVTSLPIGSLSPINPGLAFTRAAGVDYLIYCQFSPPKVVRQALSGSGQLDQATQIAGGGAVYPPYDEGFTGSAISLSDGLSAIAADALGNVYLGDTWRQADPDDHAHGRVRYTNFLKFTELFSVLGLFAQTAYGPPGALGYQAGLGRPQGLAVSGAGTLYVATGGADHRLVRLQP